MYYLEHYSPNLLGIICFFRRVLGNGIMEGWKIGRLGDLKDSCTHYSITPIFHYSNPSFIINKSKFPVFLQHLYTVQN